MDFRVAGPKSGGRYPAEVHEYRTLYQFSRNKSSGGNERLFTSGGSLFVVPRPENRAPAEGWYDEERTRPAGRARYLRGEGRTGRFSRLVITRLDRVILFKNEGDMPLVLPIRMKITAGKARAYKKPKKALTCGKNGFKQEDLEFLMPWPQPAWRHVMEVFLHGLCNRKRECRVPVYDIGRLFL